MTVVMSFIFLSCKKFIAIFNLILCTIRSKNAKYRATLC